MTSPDPVPLPPLPVAAIVTTDGMTWSATEVTAHALTVEEPGAARDPDVAVDPDEAVAAQMTPPITPPTTSAAPAAAHSHRREIRACSGSAASAPVRIEISGSQRCRDTAGRRCCWPRPAGPPRPAPPR